MTAIANPGSVVPIRWASEPSHIRMEAHAACQRLAAEFPDAEPDSIQALMDLVLRRTLNSSVESFRVVLAERSVRARLHEVAIDRSR
jgi:hypothetical protein